MWQEQSKGRTGWNRKPSRGGNVVYVYQEGKSVPDALPEPPPYEGKRAEPKNTPIPLYPVFNVNGSYFSPNTPITLMPSLNGSATGGGDLQLAAIKPLHRLPLPSSQTAQFVSCPQHRSRSLAHHLLQTSPTSQVPSRHLPRLS